jgi:hypothetical protein
MLNNRYDGLKSGRVKPSPAREFLKAFAVREDELLKKHSPR